MTETGLAIFVLVSFLLPIPILAWLDRSNSKSDAVRFRDLTCHSSAQTPVDGERVVRGQTINPGHQAVPRQGHVFPKWETAPEYELGPSIFVEIIEPR